MGYKVRYVYDQLGRFKKVEKFKNGAWIAQEENGYDQLSRRIWSKDISGDQTSYQYDAIDRVIRITHPDQTYKQIQYLDAWIYDGATNQVQTIDEEGHVLIEYFNKLGQKVAEQLLDTIRYEYDQAGNLVKKIDANGKSTQYVYDDLSRLIQVTNALYETTSYEYDNFGNLIKIIYRIIRKPSMTIREEFPKKLTGWDKSSNSNTTVTATWLKRLTDKAKRLCTPMIQGTD